MLAPSGEDVLAQESEGFILFLKSTTTDNEGELTNIWEQKLIKIFEGSHHSIAIGKPNEIFQTLDAPKIYLSEDERETRILELMQKASMIVIPMTKTKESQGEIEQILSKAAPSKLLFFLPLSRDYSYTDVEGYQQFTRGMAPFVTKPFPPYPNELRYAVLATFNNDGEPIILKPARSFTFLEKFVGWSPFAVRLLDNLYLLSITRSIQQKLKSRMHWSFAMDYLSAVIRVGISAFYLFLIASLIIGLVVALFGALASHC